MENLSSQLKILLNKQVKFQKLLNYPIESKLNKDRYELSEIYVFKLIEEAIEVRKEFPSIMNHREKNKIIENRQRVLEEMCDVFLFFLNLMIVWKVDFIEFIKIVENVQKNNFNKLK